MSIIELIDELEVAEDVLRETEARHASEVAAYGDSWPGAQLHIARMRKYVNHLHQQITAWAA